jgi:hypothetical protein
LVGPKLLDAQDPQFILKSFVGVLSYLIGASAAWFSVNGALVIYLLTPLFFIVPPTRRGVVRLGAAKGEGSPGFNHVLKLGWGSRFSFFGRRPYVVWDLSPNNSGSGRTQ